MDITWRMRMLLRLGVGLLGMCLTAIPGDAADYLGVAVGDKLAQVGVSGFGGPAKVLLEGMQGKEVVVVVTGTFIYSGRRKPPGEQDAKYRFGGRYGTGKACLPCEDKKDARLSFQIDGDYREPMKEEFASHTYVYTRKVAPNGEIMFKVADEDYTDNSGDELKVTIFKQPERSRGGRPPQSR